MVELKTSAGKINNKDLPNETEVQKDPVKSLGADTTNCSTVSEILQKAHLNWTVSKRPIVTTRYVTCKNTPLLSSNGTLANVNLRQRLKEILSKGSLSDEDKSEIREALTETENEFVPHEFEFSIVRDDTNYPFATVGSTYQTVSNEECLGILEGFLTERTAEIKRAGFFDNGEVCWALVQFPGSLEVAPETKLDQYMRLTWSHDGSYKISAIFQAYTKKGIIISPEVPGAKVSFDLRHTTNVKERLALAKTLLEKGSEYFKRLQEKADDLVSMPFTTSDMNEYLQVLLPESKSKKVNKHGEETKSRSEKTRERIMEIFEEEDNANISKTKWSAYLSVCQWSDEEKPIRVTRQHEFTNKDGEVTDPEKKDLRERETRVKGTWLKNGSAHTFKNKAFQAIL